MQDDSKTTGPIDLGRHKRKDIRRLQREGGGALVEEINTAIDVLKGRGVNVAHATPIIIVVKEKKKKKLRLGGNMPTPW